MRTSIQTRLLVVGGSADDLRTLRRVLPDWVVSRAASAGQAQSRLRSARVTAILTERDLPDGTWKDLLPQEASGPEPPPLMVMCTQADNRLWSEVLNLGGQDVLLKPLHPAEVVRVIQVAVRRREPARVSAASAGCPVPAMPAGKAPEADGTE